MTEYDTDYKAQMKHWQASAREQDKRIAQAKAALRAIHTWATYRQGEALEAGKVADLCELTLQELG